MVACQCRSLLSPVASYSHHYHVGQSPECRLFLQTLDERWPDVSLLKRRIQISLQQLWRIKDNILCRPMNLTSYSREGVLYETQLYHSQQWIHYSIQLILFVRLHTVLQIRLRNLALESFSKASWTRSVTSATFTTAILEHRWIWNINF